MTKEQFIKKTIEDLPTRDLRYEMTDNEWYGWFEDVYDYALKQGESLPIDSVSQQRELLKAFLQYVNCSDTDSKVSFDLLDKYLNSL